MRLTELAHSIIAAVTKDGDIVIDATVGNGHDTLFLAKQVGHLGCVYGFDIQDAALNKTEMRLARELDRHSVTLLKCCHSKMETALPKDCAGQIAGVMFNLGYLPGADHSIVTGPESTLKAIASAARLLRSGGIITVVAYGGHDRGETEVQALTALVQDGDDSGVHWQLRNGESDDIAVPRLFVGTRK